MRKKQKTNLDELCRVLREINRPDAAQRLEAMDPMPYILMYNVGPNISYSELLNDAFYWSDTKEGEDYWATVHELLEGWDEDHLSNTSDD